MRGAQAGKPVRGSLDTRELSLGSTRGPGGFSGTLRNCTYGWPQAFARESPASSDSDVAVKRHRLCWDVIQKASDTGSVRCFNDDRPTVGNGRRGHHYFGAASRRR